MITIFDVAIARGAKADEGGGVSLGEFQRVGLAALGGCARCGESLAAYNASPSQLAVWLCRQCVGAIGFEDVAAFEAWEADRKAHPRPWPGKTDPVTFRRVEGT